jgi:hypothetical protein
MKKIDGVIRWTVIYSAECVIFSGNGWVAPTNPSRIFKTIELSKSLIPYVLPIEHIAIIQKPGNKSGLTRKFIY